MTDTTEYTTAEQALDEWIVAATEEIGDDGPANREQADRLAWALRRVRSERAEAKAAAQARVQLVQTWFVGVDDQLAKREADLVEMLTGFTRAETDRTGLRTIALPSGAALQRRKRQPKMELAHGVDEGAFVEDLRRKFQLPQAIKTTTTAKVAELKALLEPGDVIADYAGNVDDGYEARQALLAGDDDSGFTVVDGVVFIVPTDDRFEVKTP